MLEARGSGGSNLVEGPSFGILCLLVLPALLLGVVSCSTEPIPVHDKGLQANPTRYLRYTLRGTPAGYYYKAYRSNYLSDPPIFKPGTKVNIRLYSQDRIDLAVEGDEVRIFHRDSPFPTTPDQIRQVIEKHFAVTRQELNLDAIEPDIRKQVMEGNVAIGMTKDQVFAAIGYPCFIDNYVPADSLDRLRIRESDTWIFRYSDFPLGVTSWTKYWTYRFDDQDRLVEVLR